MLLTKRIQRITQTYVAEQTEILVLRIPVSVLKLLRERANQEDRSVAYIVRNLLKSALGKKR